MWAITRIYGYETSRFEFRNRGLIKVTGIVIPGSSWVILSTPVVSRRKQLSKRCLGLPISYSNQYGIGNGRNSVKALC